MNAVAYFNLAKRSLLRGGNPFVDAIDSMREILNVLLNYNSNVKLNKFRHNLYIQQFKRMEGFLSQSSPYTVRGDRMDRKF